MGEGGKAVLAVPMRACSVHRTRWRCIVLTGALDLYGPGGFMRCMLAEGWVLKMGR